MYNTTDMNNQNKKSAMGKKVLSLFLIATAVLMWTSTSAQVGIGASAFVPQQSAMLELQLGNPASPRGFLMPRFDLGHENSMLSNSPAEALLYYSKDKQQFKFYNGTSFLSLNPWNVNADYSRLIYNPGISFRVGIGNNNPQSTLDVTGDVNASGNIKGIGMIPPGGVIMFSGTLAGKFDATGLGIAGTEYEGWALCNSQNTTPDLRGRFIVSYDERTGGTLPAFSDATYNTINNSGGSKEVTLTVAQMPAHNHGGATGTNGNHSHTIPGYDNAGWAFPVARRADNRDGGGNFVPPDGFIPTNTTGNHSHTIPSQGGDLAHENRPPYFVLAFIMRVQ